MEDFNKFINHNDPTRKIDLDSVSIEEQYAKLTEEEKIQIGAKLLGMKNRIPVDIKTFVFDEYFLGVDQLTNRGKAIFPYWVDKLEEIFPNPIMTRFPYVLLTGAIGTGKSTMSKIMGLYYYHRLDCTDSVYNALSIAGGTKLAIGFYHNSEQTARKDFLNYYKLVFEVSPYFRHLYNNPPIRLIAAGAKSKSGVIGTQLIYTVLSELSFWSPKDGVEKVSEILTRYESRFKTKRYTFGGVVADSSANMDDSSSAVEKFKEGVDVNDLFTVSPSLWAVRPELFSESKGKTFKFYRGDSIRGPYCIENDDDIIRNNLDPDRIIDVPISAKPRFLLDAERSLKDLAGYTYNDSSNLFFHNDLSHLIKCSSIRNLAPEIITVDFYDKTDTIFDKVSSMVYRIPRGTNLFLHYDIGLRTDICGCAISYYSGETVIGNASLPTFKFPLIFGVSRKKGQATSLDHLYQFIKDLMSHGYYVTVSADSFASAGLLQSCERDSIPYKMISVDRTMDAGIMFKNVVNTERAELVYNNVLLREASEIRIVGNGKNGDHIKLDHPAISSCTMFDYAGKPAGTMPSSKDIFDACCGSLFSCYQKYAEYKENGSAGGVGKSLEALNHITKDAREESQKIFQDMLESIF